MDHDEPLITVDAGRCERSGSTIVPQPAHGKIILRVVEDGLLSFIWKRNDGEIMDDLIIMPGDCTFSIAGNPDNRTFVLKFLSSSLRNFYWFHAEDKSKDTELCKRIDDILTNPIVEEEDSEDINPDIDMSVSQKPVYNKDILNSDWLRSLVAGIQVPGNSGTAGKGNSGTSAQSKWKDISLLQVLSPENLGNLFDSPDTCAELYPYLPENCPKTPYELKDVVRSPQFQHGVRSLSQAIQSGQLAPLLMELGVEANGPVFSVQQFLDAVEENARKKESNEK